MGPMRFLMRVNKIRLFMSLLFTNFEIRNVSIIEYLNGLKKKNELSI